MFQIQFNGRRPRPDARRGVITLLAAIFSVVVVGLVAFAVDVGYVLSVKEEMQRTADSAALASCWDYAQQLANGADSNNAQLSGRAAASQYTSSNKVGNLGLAIETNYSNTPGGDLVFGYVNDLYDASAQLDTSSPDLFNAVQVKVRRDDTMNGQAPLFFARIFGRTGQPLNATATAAIVRDVKGFQTSSGGGNLDLLPFALDLETFDAWIAGCGGDNWTWDGVNQRICPGADGILEVNLYPQDTGSPGNRGTVDIGSSNNSTRDIARQILYGINASDLAHHNGVLEFNECGKLYLNGDTGISAGVKDELACIKGQPRVIPIFSEVNGPGNNACYTIVKWFGIRIMDVKLTGPMKKKHVTIQAAPIVVRGVIPSTTAGSSAYVYSPAVLLQ